MKLLSENEDTVLRDVVFEVRSTTSDFVPKTKDSTEVESLKTGVS
ncbi:MAG: hypothetical protein ABIV43_02510 [Candidatus Saccharimonadales bacterium]